MNEAKQFMMSMMQTMKERIGNPFIGAFAAAWLIWNFKIVLVIIGNGKEGWRDKIKFIFIELMPSDWDWFIHGYLYPGFAAFTWVFILPPVLRFIHVWHEEQANKTKEAIYKATSKKVITKEEELELRNHITEEYIKLTEQREKSAKALQDSVRTQKELSDQIAENSTQIINLQSEKAELEKEKSNLKASVNNLNAIINPNALEVVNSDLEDQSVKNNILTKIGFSISKIESKELSLVAHEHYNVYLPIQILRDVIYEETLILNRNQILDEITAFTLIKISQIEQSRINENGIDMEMISFEKTINSDWVNKSPSLTRNLIKDGYVARLPGVERIRILPKAIRAGILLTKLGFRTNVALASRISSRL